MRSSCSLALVSLLAGCGAPAPRQEAPLVDVSELALAEEDPFADGPPDAACDEAGFAYEGAVFEVDTTLCRYATFTAPSLADVRAGERVRLIAWHLPLTAPADSQAHLALRLGELTLWEEHIAIPSDERFYREVAVLDEDVPAGAPLYFHVHNHGDNSYRLLEVVREAAAMDEGEAP